jgi:hypothetical protein
MDVLNGMDLSGMLVMVEGILKGLTDEQLAQAGELIKAEQAARAQQA